MLRCTIGDLKGRSCKEKNVHDLVVSEFAELPIRSMRLYIVHTLTDQNRSTRPWLAEMHFVERLRKTPGWGVMHSGMRESQNSYLK